MDDDTLKNLTSGQMPDDSDTNQQQSQPEEEPVKPKQNYAFLTPTEAGYRETDPSKISAAPRPQPGMTFTPTGGSVSSINHQLNRSPEDEHAEKNQQESSPKLQEPNGSTPQPPDQQAS